jgi:hypothetical protein
MDSKGEVKKPEP